MRKRSSLLVRRPSRAGTPSHGSSLILHPIVTKGGARVSPGFHAEPPDLGGRAPTRSRPSATGPTWCGSHGPVAQRAGSLACPTGTGPLRRALGRVSRHATPSVATNVATLFPAWP